MAALEANIAAAGSVTGMLKAGLGAREITGKLLAGLGGAADEGFSLSPRFGPCEPSGLQDRMRSAVAALGEEEVRGILEEQGQVDRVEPWEFQATQPTPGRVKRREESGAYTMLWFTAPGRQGCICRAAGEGAA